MPKCKTTYVIAIDAEGNPYLFATCLSDAKHYLSQGYVEIAEHIGDKTVVHRVIGALVTLDVDEEKLVDAIREARKLWR